MIGKLLKLSFTTILHNKMRSLLTMLGIIIGVTSVIVLVSLVQGATSGITQRIAGMGSNQIVAMVTGEDVTVLRRDIETLKAYPAIAQVAPVCSANLSAKKGRNNKSLQVIGVTPAYFEVRDIAIQSGRLIMEPDLTDYSNVAVIGTQVADELFETRDAVGGTLTVGDRIYRVIGVLSEQARSFGGSGNNQILIPFTTAQRVTGVTAVTTFYVQASRPETVQQSLNLTEALLLRLTRDADSFTVNNQANILETMQAVTNTMTLLLAGIAAISLVVGGIGIMNIMLVSVSERTREIGIRKAIGAKKRHIMFQFLIESCVLSLLGGLIGWVVSWCCISVYNSVSAGGVVINWAVGLATILFCLLIGVISGSYPAAKAAGLQPIEALRML